MHGQQNVKIRIFQCRTIRRAGSLDSRLLEFYCTLCYRTIP